MFNDSFRLLVYIALLLYIMQTIALLINFIFFSFTLKKNHGLYSVNLHNNNYRYLFYILVFLFAGLPPFFMFFIKILIILKLGGSLWFLILFLILNSVILYYYLNFINKFKFLTSNNTINKQLDSHIKSLNMLLHIIFFNALAIFLIQYCLFIF